MALTTEHVTRPADERQPDADQRPDLSGPDPAAAFGRLFDEHARSLYRYLARRAGDSVADDLWPLPKYAEILFIK